MRRIWNRVAVLGHDDNLNAIHNRLGFHVSLVRQARQSLKAKRLKLEPGEKKKKDSSRYERLRELYICVYPNDACMNENARRTTLGLDSTTVHSLLPPYSPITNMNKCGVTTW